MAKTENNINKKKKEKIGKYNKVEKPSSIGSSYDPDLINRLSEYSTLRGVKRTELVSNLIAKELDDKILNNIGINLEEPLYFNYKELLENGSVKCTSIKPTTNLQDINIIKNVPNNLDRFIEKEDYFTYGFEDNPNQHMGIMFSYNDGYENKPKYLVFDLHDDSLSEISKAEITLKISILELDDLTTYLDIDQYKELINDLKYVSASLEKNMEKEVKLKKKLLFGRKNTDDAIACLSEEEILEIEDIVSSKMWFLYHNSSLFMPLKVYSELQKLILVYDKKNVEEFEKIQKETYGTDLTKQELEQFITTFDYNFNLQFLILFDRILFGFENDNGEDINLINEFIREYLTDDGI